MPVGAVTAVATVGSGYLANKGAKDAARSANRGAQAGIDEQRAAREQFQQNIQPYLDFAQNSALPGLQALASGDYSAFEDSPDYLYARDQMQKGVERGAAARGSLYSGGTNVDLAGALGGLASQNLGNYRGYLMDIARMGQNAAVGAGSLGQQNANAISGLLGQQGQNSANAAIGGANAWGNALQGLAGLGGQFMGSRSSAYNPMTPVQRQSTPMPPATVNVPNVNFGGWG